MVPLTILVNNMLWLPLFTVCLNGALAESGMLRGLEEKQENAVCLTEERCRQKFQDMDLGSYFYVNNWPTKGCFSKNNLVYFGTGGTVDEMTENDLPGIQERIWCDSETEAPAAKPSKQPMANPTAKLVTDTPSKNPTLKPVTYSSSIEPTLKPVTDRPTKLTANALLDRPTKQPTLKSFTESPTKQPTKKPVTDSPTKLPTVKLVTDSPSKQPAATPPVTDSPHQNPDSMSAIDSPTMQHTINQATPSPTKKPAQKQPIAAAPAVANSPHENPTTTPLIVNTTTEASTKGGEDAASKDDGSFLVDITLTPTLQPFTPKPIGSPIELTIDAPSKSLEVTTSSPTSVPTTSPSVKITQPPMKSPAMLMETSLSSLSSTTKSPSIAPIASSPSTVNETVSPTTSSSSSSRTTPTTSSNSPSSLVSPTLPSKPVASQASNATTEHGGSSSSAKPVVGNPTKQPGSPTKQSTQKQPTAALPVVTDSPRDNTTATPVIDSTVTKAPTNGGEGAASEDDGSFLVDSKPGVGEEEHGESVENYLAKSTTSEEESPPVGNKLWVVGIIGGVGVGALFVAMYAAKVRRRNNANAQQQDDVRSKGIDSLVIENPDLAENPGFNVSYEAA